MTEILHAIVYDHSTRPRKYDNIVITTSKNEILVKDNKQTDLFKCPQIEKLNVWYAKYKTDEMNY